LAQATAIGLAPAAHLYAPWLSSGSETFALYTGKSLTYLLTYLYAVN